MSSPVPGLAGLPDGSTARAPGERDLSDIVALLAAGRGERDKPVDVESVTANVLGLGSWTRQQLVVHDDAGTLQGWAVVHDRAAGRTNVELVVARTGVQDAIAAALLDWLVQTAAGVARSRAVPVTRLDITPGAADARVQGWLAAVGFRHARDWLQMLRPVTAEDSAAAQAPPRAGVVVRRVREHASGLPVAADVQTVHRLLEESFADHFNSYRESFPEFVQRLREDPWHRWDHWWIAEVEGAPGGALISSVSPSDRQGRFGSYIDYIGVHRQSRGRGVAKELLRTVVADTAQRGRHWVGLEVDAASPTGADGLYRSLGWEVDQVTQSWHRDVPAAPPTPR